MTAAPVQHRGHRVFIAIGAALFVGTFLFRLLEPIFHNDHFEYFALATEMLHGAIPGVDFFDPSRPLQYSLTAFGLLFGHQLLAEALIAITVLSAGSVLVFALGVRLTGSRALGLFAAVVVIAALPRLYSYPKVLVPALGILAWCRYIDQPSRRRLVAVALTTVLGFYFRFDYIAWLGLATVAGLIAMHWREHSLLLRRGLEYGAIAAVLCGPYLLFQVVAGGVLTSGPSTGRLTRVLQGEDVVAFEAFKIPGDGPLISWRPAGPVSNIRWRPAVTDTQRATLEQRYHLYTVRPLEEHGWQYVLTDPSPATLQQLIHDPSVDGTTNIDDRGHVLREAPWVMLQRWLHVPVVDSPALNRENATTYLYGVMFFTPVCAAALLALQLARRRSPPGELPAIAAILVLAALFNVFLIRGNVDSRLPDVLIPNVLLWVWLARTLVREWPGIATRAGLVLVAATLLIAIDLYSASLDHLGATDLLSTPVRTARHLKYAVAGLLHPAEAFAPPGSIGLRALVRYVNRCTTPDDRLLVLGYQPEFFFYSDRRMAGGNPVYQSNLGAGPKQQALIVSRLQRQRVPIVLLPMNRLFDIESTYSVVNAYVDSRYTVAKESGFGEDRAFRVMVDRTIQPTRIDPELQLPCFTPGTAPG